MGLRPIPPPATTFVIDRPGVHRESGLPRFQEATIRERVQAHSAGRSNGQRALPDHGAD